MGGNVFPNLKRITKAEFEDLANEVVFKLKGSIYPEPQMGLVYVTRSYFSKPTFGDMDIVVETDYLKPDWIEELKLAFGLSEGEAVKNGDVLSFRYKDFQIDLILTKSCDFSTTFDYFSWNDLSNLMGRITYKHGLKFGHRGTYITLKDGSHQIGEVLVTKHTFELCEYFGWDFSEWNNGFETMEDAYRWVVKSPFFNKSVFALENRNHVARVRDKKRPNYTAFLKWLETQEGLPEYPYEDHDSRGGYYLRQPYYDMLLEKWPHVKRRVELKMENYNREKKFKEKFNGTIVSEVTGLENIELGNLMKYIKSAFEKNPFIKEDLIDHLGEDEIRAMIGTFRSMFDQGTEYPSLEL